MPNKEKILEEIKEMVSKKDPKLNKKAKIIAMKNNIKLKELRKNFCQKCYYPLEEAQRRIKKGFLVIHCPNCKRIIRWRVKKENRKFKNTKNN
ncbi:MAG: hypothetical protein QW273_01615 [Candidatus Pacearchaeota archaeon]